MTGNRAEKTTYLSLDSGKCSDAERGGRNGGRRKGRNIGDFTYNNKIQTLMGLL